MNILSGFDGMSCLQQALTNLGVKDYTYFRSEIDKYPIQVTQDNFPNTIQIGDITKVYTKINKAFDSYYIRPGSIELFAGGSPCTNLSFAGKQKGLVTKENIEITNLEQYLDLKERGFEFEGQSYLFWEFIRIRDEVKPKKFLLENVVMDKKWERVFNKAIGFESVKINSALVVAQNRKRLYWVGELQEDGTYKKVEIEQPQDRGILLKDILEDEVDEKYYLSEETYEKLKKFESNSRLSDLDGKSYCLNTMQGGHRQPKILANINPSGKGMNGNIYNTDVKSPTLTTNKGEGVKILNRPHGYFKGSIHTEKSPTIRSQVEGNILKQEENRIRKLTPIECERLQGVKDNYSACVSNSQRYKMLGNGWTIPVIEYILKYLI